MGVYHGGDGGGGDGVDAGEVGLLEERLCRGRAELAPAKEFQFEN